MRSWTKSKAADGNASPVASPGTKLDGKSPLGGHLPRRIEHARLAIHADYPAARPDLGAQQIKNPRRSAADVDHGSARGYVHSLQELPSLFGVHLSLADQMLDLGGAIPQQVPVTRPSAAGRCHSTQDSARQ